MHAQAFSDSSPKTGEPMSSMYLTQSLHRTIQQKPRGIATRFQGREHTWTQFGERVARLAGALQALGVKPGDRVAMMAMNALNTSASQPAGSEDANCAPISEPIMMPSDIARTRSQRTAPRLCWARTLEMEVKRMEASDVAMATLITSCGPNPL